MSLPTFESAESRKKLELYDYNSLYADCKILDYYTEVLNEPTLDSSVRKLVQTQYDQLKLQNDSSKMLKISFQSLKNFQKILKQVRQTNGKTPVYIHEMMSLCTIQLPSPPPVFRSPELEARLEKLRAKAANDEYQRMVNNVAKKKWEADDTIGSQVKVVNAQIMVVINFILTVCGAFAFGYKAVEYNLPSPDVSLQLTAGVTLATIVFFADVYFIIKDQV